MEIKIRAIRVEDAEEQKNNFKNYTYGHAKNSVL